MNKFLFSLFIFAANISLAQLPAESDPHRGMYFDRFLKASPTVSHAPDPVYSILATDTNSDGIFEKEDAYLNYCCESHITYIALYDMGNTINEGRMAWNENTKRYEDLEAHLCRFMEKAKHEYGVTQIGAVSGSAGFFSELEDYMNKYPVSPACTTCQADFDVLNIEDEFWGDCNGDLPAFINIMDAMYNLKTTYNAAHPDNPLTTEVYLAFLDHCIVPGLVETAEVIDGCKNCSPFAGCSNPHPRKIDRVLYSLMSGSPAGIPGEIHVFENVNTFDSTDMHPMLYSESQFTGGTYDFLGPWLESDPLHTIFTAEDYAYYSWRTSSSVAFGQPQMNDVQPGGIHWFAGSHMVQRFKEPKVIKVLETYCTTDSALITFHYLGPDETGTNYEFHVTRDSDGAVVYPTDGGQFTGVSHSTVNDPGLRCIDFADTITFPKLFLRNGNYTTHITLSYNHGTGCSYSSECKFAVDDKPRIEVAGEKEFCNGFSTFLVTNAGAANYDWYRNGKLISSGFLNQLKVQDDGDYYCSITGGSCPSLTDTVHITVHPLPNVELNGVCNGNGTVTLKTNLLPANATSTQLFGAGGVTYKWNNAATTDQITVSNADSYKVTVTDPYSGCSIYRDLKIPSPLSTAYTASINVDHPLTTNCSNDAVLTASLSPTPGLYDPLRFLWSNGSNSSTISGVSPGTYTVTIKNYNLACSFYASVTIGNPGLNAPVMNETVTPSTCNNTNGGSIALNPSGGNPPFSFEWRDIPNENSYDPYTRDQQNLFPGIYSLLVTDSNGCRFNYSYTVNKTDGPILVSEGSVTPVNGCATNQNGSASVNISGGVSPYSQTWTHVNGQQFPNGTNLSAGSYRVIVTDQSGCTGYSYIHVPSQSEPIHTELLDSSQTKLICDSTSTGKLYVCIHGGTVPYAVNSPWAMQMNIISLENLNAGEYPYTITDSAGCIFSDTLNIDSALLNMNAIPVHTTCIGCSNGEIQLSFGGGWPPYSFSWTPTIGQIVGNEIKNLSAGIYSVCITDSNECSVCSQVEILDDPLSVISYTNNSQVKLFPNPVSESFSIRITENDQSSFNFSIKNLLGQTLMRKNNLQENQSFDVSNLSEGIYLLEIRKNETPFGLIRFVVSR